MPKRTRSLGAGAFGVAIFLIVAVLLTGKERTMAQVDAESANRATVQAAFDKWRAGTASVFDLLAPDATWTIVGKSAASATYSSKHAFMEEVIRPFNARMSSGLVPTVRGLYADGNWVIVLFDGVAMAKDGIPYENTYTWYLEMREGQIVNAIAFFDSIAFNDLWSRVTPSEI